MGSLVQCNLENGCDALLKYYNTSFLNHPDMDPHLKGACYEEAKKCADTNYARADESLKRTVLAELILSNQNQQDPFADPATKKPYADFIAGPRSLTLQWSSYYKKLIYIFGEKHSEDYDCPKIEGKITMLVEDYIKQLYINGDMFFDVFDETSAFFKNRQPYIVPYNSRITGIRNHFTQCLFNANLDENCKKGRVHYFDIRQMEGMEYGNTSNFIRKYTTSYVKNKQKYIDYLNDFFKELQVLQMISDVASYSPEEFMKSLKNEFNTNYLFEKELRKSTMKDKISSFIDENIKKYNVLIQSIIDDIHLLTDMLPNYEDEEDRSIMFDDDETKKYPSYNFDVLKDEDVDGDNDNHYFSLRSLLDAICVKLILVESLLADGYLLARVFKNFNIDEEEVTKRRVTDEPDEPHNIVIYAGDNHSDMYREFLKKKLGFELIAVTGKDWRDKHSKNPYENCVSMDDFPQPFFEYHEKVNWLEDVSSDKTLPRRSSRLNKTLPTPRNISKKPYKDWVKKESRSKKGLYYYSNEEKQKTQFKRPVDYSSDEEEEEEDMQE